MRCDTILSPNDNPVVVGRLQASNIDDPSQRGIRPEVDYRGQIAYADTILELLREWNDGDEFKLHQVDHAHTARGSVCVLDVEVGSNEGGWTFVTYVGMFGDDDYLFRLTAFENDATTVILNDGLIRA